MAAFILAMVLALILGFASHRASICTVRAVAEVMSSRNGSMFASVGRSVLWVWALTLPIFWLIPSAGSGILGWQLSGMALLGGMSFGLGAAVNGGCAYSTMARLVDGGGLLLAARYRLSTAALLIGLPGALLFLLYGPFGYTATFELVIEGAFGTRPWPPSMRWVLLIAVLCGMLASTVQRGSFRIDWRPRREWLLNAMGGALMGFGTALAPGGNDALVLYGVPTVSPYALPTYAA